MQIVHAVAVYGVSCFGHSAFGDSVGLGPLPTVAKGGVPETRNTIHEKRVSNPVSPDNSPISYDLRPDYPGNCR